MVDHGSSPRLARARDVKTMVTSFAKELVQEKADALLQGRGSLDILTLLGVYSVTPTLLITVSLVDYLTVKANMDANAKLKLSDEELLAQMR